MNGRAYGARGGTENLSPSHYSDGKHTSTLGHALGRVPLPLLELKRPSRPRVHTDAHQLTPSRGLCTPVSPVVLCIDEIRI